MRANRKRTARAKLLAQRVAQNSTNMRLFRFATKLFDRIVDSQNNVGPLDLRTPLHINALFLWHIACT
jgi:hypothetical protein